MLILGSRRASGIINPNVRGRPIVSGGTLRTDTGNIIRSARVGPNKVEAKNATIWANARALGLNAMRCGVTLDNKPMSDVLAFIDAVVAASKNNRMYLILSNPESAPGDWWLNISANKTKALTFWNTVADRYKNEEHVIYEQINEPESGWGLWSNYVNSDFTPTPLLTALHEVFLAIRAKAPNTVILTPSPANIKDTKGVSHYVNILNTFNSLGGVDWSKTVWSFHYYNQTFSMGINNITSTDGAVAALTWLRSRYPIVCTETNWWMETGRRELLDGLDSMEDAKVGWVLMTYPNQVGPLPDPIPPATNIRTDWPDSIAMYDPPGYIVRKVAQLRSRGYNIPVE